MGPMDIITLIPEDLFDFLAAETKVDHKVPKLKGKNLSPQGLLSRDPAASRNLS